MSRKTIALWAMLSRAMGQHIFQALSIKRRSHNNLSWQTRVGKLRKVDKLFPSHVKRVSNNKHGNLQHGRFSSVVALMYNSETEEKKQRNRKRRRNRKVWTKPSLSVRSSVLFCLFLFVSLQAKDETSRTAGQLNLKSVGSRPPFCDVSRK